MASRGRISLIMELDLSEIASCLHCSGSYHGRALGFQQDSRLVEPGDLFFALQGERVDGHSFLKQIASQGAIGAVVSSEYQGESFGLQLFFVPDVLEALQELARFQHRKHSPFVIGVTGSVGKTTTKEFITTILSGKHLVAKTPGNSNSQVGMPLAILNQKEACEILVVEMGMSAPGNITKLVSILPPDLSVITQIALAHVIFFEEGIEGIAKAKAEILLHPQTKVAVLNQSTLSFSSCLQGSCKKISYGSWESQCDQRWQRMEDGQIKMQGKEGEVFLFELPFTADHLIENAVGAITVALQCGMVFSEISPRLPLLQLSQKRFETVEKDGIVFINDSYNANPTSMKAALSSLPVPSSQNKRIGVLGAMRELGIYEEKSHKEIGEFASQHLDYLLCLGKECAPLLKAFQEKGKPGEHFSDLACLKKRVFEISEKGDVVLLKGSNSNQLWQILEH